MRSLFSVLVLAFLLLGSAFAKEVKVGDISSDYDSNKTKFFLEINDNGSIDAVRFLMTAPNGGVVQDDTHPAERVIAEGAVIYWNGNYEVVRLRVKDFSVDKGGIAVLDYLVNGLTGARRVVTLNLTKNAAGAFELSYNGKTVNKFAIQANRNAFGIVVGIRGIYPSLL
jgi:hypothetical protein